MIDFDNLTPKEIVQELDKYIVGQDKAKKLVAIALRNRQRRQKLPDDLRDEVAPKNIIMIGPTGVGKTEIARRLSKLSGAPFIKVEATKYTEVGYVGRDVESMVRDLLSVSMSMVKNEMQENVRKTAESRTEEALLDLLLPGVKPGKPDAAMGSQNNSVTVTPASDAAVSTREKFREKLQKGELEDKQVEVDVVKRNSPSMQIFSGTNFEEMDIQLGSLGNIFGNKKKKKKVSIKQAREIILAEEMDKLIDMDQVADIAKHRCEQMGIIFLDEIDKVAGSANRQGADVSREGVQRDILPIVEGSQVNTRYGIIDTSHILFIAAGAFHMSKPSDLIPELQGRFPLRVELQALSAADFVKILTQPRNALITQYVELLKTEEVTLEFDEAAIHRISEIAMDVNSKTENIGARRLHTIMENLLEDISFNATDIKGQTIKVTKDYVNERLNEIIEDRDLTRFIL
ncbi:MAG: ATP-dependent protease ATPase subunit HslU [Spirochaetales bacterium]|nr:ATP-dependent protease ATPase subunit HslU [Spirochaetales bacterium]